jgi:RNase P subunit RPR2
MKRILARKCRHEYDKNAMVVSHKKNEGINIDITLHWCRKCGTAKRIAVYSDSDGYRRIVDMFHPEYMYQSDRV